MVFVFNVVTIIASFALKKKKKKENNLDPFI